MITNRKNTYLFIDGAYLRRLCEVYGRLLFGDMVIPFDYDTFTKSRKYDRTFYYDCEPYKKGDETTTDYEERLKEYRTWVSDVSKIDGFHVFIGTIGKSGKKSTQKQVDVKIAVDMLSHTHKGNMRRAVLLSGDLDFKPILDELVGLGMYTTLIYDPKSTSRELMIAPDQNEEIDLLWLLANSQPWFRSEYAVSLRRGADPGEFDKRYYDEKTGKDADGHRITLGITRNKSFASYISVIKKSKPLNEKLLYSHRSHEYLVKFYEKGYSHVEWD